MITTDKLTVRFGSQTLFENVSIKFTPGNCYGVIGANGAGKSTLLRVLSGEIEPTSGEIHISKGQRIAVLRQDHFAFDNYKVIDTVIMGHKKLYDIMQERDALYAKPDFNDEDGIKVAHLEEEFAELDGWQAEAMAASLLSDLGISDKMHYELMSELSGSEKVRVLLAQALFGNPDILLLDEPTNHLDLNTIAWLEEFLINFPNLVIVVSHDRKFLDNVCTHMADIDYKSHAIGPPMEAMRPTITINTPQAGPIAEMRPILKALFASPFSRFTSTAAFFACRINNNACAREIRTVIPHNPQNTGEFAIVK